MNSAKSKGKPIIFSEKIIGIYHAVRTFFTGFPCKCQGHGEDFECLYETEETCGDNEDCTECVSSWKEYGGRHSPKNWNIKWPWIICFILWGFPYRDFPDCRSCNFLKKKRCTVKDIKIENESDWEFRCRHYLHKKSESAKTINFTE
jgi:hypothetical protein